MVSKIAIFDWGGETVHSYYVAQELSKNGFAVDIFLFVPFVRVPYFNLVSFFPEGVPGNITIIQINGSRLLDKLSKALSFTQLVMHPFPSVYLQLGLPNKTRKRFSSSHYKYIIPVSTYSLFWVYKTDPAALRKVLQYSLEIDQLTDPHVRKYWKLYALIRIEARLLGSIRGLIIQDQMREKALLNGAIHRNLRIIYLPVSIPGEIFTGTSNYLQDKFVLKPSQKVILYFGAVYQERKIEALIAAFTAIDNPDWVLVLHGGNVAFPDTGTAQNIKISDQKIPYHELYRLIGSASVGIALYDNSWPNTRLTAFSSEKIARYLQEGVPFIAFENESYFLLKQEFDCCELISRVEDLGKAIATILANYSYYRANSYQAFEKYYKLSNTIQPLAAFLREDPNG